MRKFVNTSWRLLPDPPFLLYNDILQTTFSGSKITKLSENCHFRKAAEGKEGRKSIALHNKNCRQGLDLEFMLTRFLALSNIYLT